MDNLKTVISWTLHDFCKAQCDYCPVSARGGEPPRKIEEYLRVAQLLIDSYKVKQGRSIEWIFNGGEPLDLDYFPQLLKLCKNNGEKVVLYSSGGQLWMDWWAYEPYVDHVFLTFHFWQNPAIVKYLSDLFKNKAVTVTAPIRHTHVREDLDRVKKAEEFSGIKIHKTLLYKDADTMSGPMPYSNNDLDEIDLANGIQKSQGPSSVEQKIYFENTTWDERYKDTYSQHPSYTGQLCNAGIERLNIGALGWVSGSLCNNVPGGNIWHQGWTPIQSPQKCGMISCIHPDDQLITKFSPEPLI